MGSIVVKALLWYVHLTKLSLCRLDSMLQPFISTQCVLIFDFGLVTGRLHSWNPLKWGSFTGCNFNSVPCPTLSGGTPGEIRRNICEILSSRTVSMSFQYKGGYYMPNFPPLDGKINEWTLKRQYHFQQFSICASSLIVIIKAGVGKL